MKISKTAVAIPFWFLYPFHVLPIFFLGLVKGDRSAPLLFALSIGGLAYLMIPYESMDIIRYYDTFYEISVSSFSLYELYLERPSHALINTLMLLINSVGLPKEFLPFIVVSACYYVPLKIYFDLSKKEMLTEKGFQGITVEPFYNVIFLLIVLAQIRFFQSASGLRNPLAITLSLYGVYNLFSRGLSVRGSIYLVLAALVHNSMAIVPVILLLMRIDKMQSVYRFFFKLSVPFLLLGFSSVLFFSLIGILEPFLRANDLYKPSYFDSDGAWGAGYWDNVNYRVFIYEKYIKPLPFYLASIYLYFTLGAKSRYRQLIYILFIFISVIAVARTLFDRYAYFTLLLFIIMLMVELKQKEITLWTKRFLVCFFLSLCVVSIGGGYKYRHTIAPSWSKAMYVPGSILLIEQADNTDYINRDEQKGE